jgi:hypothetical protein
MLRTLGVATLLTLAAAMPAQEAAAQDPLGGAILGGAAGAIIGGVAGGGRGAAIGAGVGAATGAIIGAEGQRRRGGYGPAEYYEPAPSVAGDPIAYCMQRFRSYDPASQTYLGYDGLRHPCP